MTRWTVILGAPALCYALLAACYAFAGACYLFLGIRLFKRRLAFLVVITAIIFTACNIPVANAAPLFRIVDIRAEYGHLIVEAQHFNPDGSHWFYELYTFQGSEAYKHPRLTNELGRLFLKRTGHVAPSAIDSEGRRIYTLPAGEQWLRHRLSRCFP